MHNLLKIGAQPFENPIELLINEAFWGLRHESVDTGPSQETGEEEILHDLSKSNNKDYFELLKDGSEYLYEGSKYSKLEFLLKLYHIKCLSGLSDKGMTMVLDLLRNEFKFAKIPISFYEAKKTINLLCLDYIKKDVCPNDYMLYWEDDVNTESCKHYHTSRWKPKKDRDIDHAPSTSKKQKKKPKKKQKKLAKKSQKNHVKARRDLQDMVIRHDLWVDENDECKLAAFAIPKNKKVAFLKTLKNILVPDGYSNRHATQTDLPYYGKLEDIVKLNYYGKFRVVLFKCQWADTTRNRGFKIDAWKFNCVNFSKLIHIGDRVDDDLYIEASQANMVYYVDDENDKEWSVVVHLKPRDLFDMGKIDEEEIYENEPYQQQEFGQFFYVDYENVQIAMEEHMTK
ncbi:hypothetical protein FXO37_04576 [Capsicum annuum]|nr:hypothetical protein FXO37_04576 [Capsicum annuum]